MLLTGLIACLLVALALFSEARAFVLLKAPSGKPCVWNLATLSGHTVKWNLAADAPAIARESMLAATAAWSAASNGTLTFVEETGGIELTWDATGAQVPDSLYLAWTTFTCNEQMDIQSAKIVINAAHYTWQRGGAGGLSIIKKQQFADLDGTVLHELGHALGLSHSDIVLNDLYGQQSDRNYPSMHSVLLPGAESLHIDDQAGIRALYSPGSDLPVTDLLVTASPNKGMAKLNVAFSQEGGDSQTHWDFGDGMTRVGASATHVFTSPGTYSVQVSSNGKVGQVTVEVEKRIKVKKPKKAKRK